MNTVLGYICIAIAFYFYDQDPLSTSGRFFNGMALGFFINHFYQKYKEKKSER